MSRKKTAPRVGHMGAKLTTMAPVTQAEVDNLASKLERYAAVHIRMRQIDNELAALRGEPPVWGDE